MFVVGLELRVRAQDLVHAPLGAYTMVASLYEPERAAYQGAIPSGRPRRYVLSGPVRNPGIEVNIAFGGRLMNEIDKSVEDVLAETLENLYRPKNVGALHRHIGVYQKGENSYFEQWNPETIQKAIKRPAPVTFLSQTHLELRLALPST